jgi:hypothetical protein
MSRDDFEEVLGAMARAELIRFADAVFEKQGKQIPYRTVSLTPAGRATDQTTPVLFVMKDAGRPVSSANARRNPVSLTLPQTPPVEPNRGRQEHERLVPSQRKRLALNRLYVPGA